MHLNLFEPVENNALLGCRILKFFFLNKRLGFYYTLLPSFIMRDANHRVLNHHFSLLFISR